MEDAQSAAWFGGQLWYAVARAWSWLMTRPRSSREITSPSSWSSEEIGGFIWQSFHSDSARPRFAWIDLASLTFAPFIRPASKSISDQQRVKQLLSACGKDRILDDRMWSPMQKGRKKEAFPEQWGEKEQDCTQDIALKHSQPPLREERVPLIAMHWLRVKEGRNPRVKAALYATGRELGKQSRMANCQIPEICPMRQSWPSWLTFWASNHCWERSSSKYRV